MCYECVTVLVITLVKSFPWAVSIVVVSHSLVVSNLIEEKGEVGKIPRSTLPFSLRDYQ